jgi:hypothetical protein
MEYDGDKMKWKEMHTSQFLIVYDHSTGNYKVDNSQFIQKIGSVYFYTQQTAENAIKEIIEPFMKAHPEFKW